MRLQPGAGRRSQGAPAADHPRTSGGGFRGGVRSGALCAVRRSVRTVRLSLASARFAGDRDPTAQLAERSRRHPGRSPARGARTSARSRLAQTAAGRRLRGARGIADARPSSGSSPGASPPASSRSWRSRTGPIRSSKPPAGGSRSRSPITGGRPPPIIGAGSRRRTASRSAGRSSAIAGRAITPTTRSRHSPRRWKPPSIRRKTPPASVSTGRRARPPRPGCRPAWPMPTLPRTTFHGSAMRRSSTVGRRSGRRQARRNRPRGDRIAGLPDRGRAGRHRAQRGFGALTRIFGTQQRARP